MSELVRDHVRLGEIAGRAEPRAQLVVEREVDVDLLIERDSRTDPSPSGQRRIPSASRCERARASRRATARRASAAAPATTSPARCRARTTRTALLRFVGRLLHGARLHRRRSAASRSRRRIRTRSRARKSDSARGESRSRRSPSAPCRMPPILGDPRRSRCPSRCPAHRVPLVRVTSCRIRRQLVKEAKIWPTCQESGRAITKSCCTSRPSMNVCTPTVAKPLLLVERDRARIFLPHAEPEHVALPRSACSMQRASARRRRRVHATPDRRRSAEPRRAPRRRLRRRSDCGEPSRSRSASRRIVGDQRRALRIRQLVVCMSTENAAAR